MTTNKQFTLSLVKRKSYSLSPHYIRKSLVLPTSNTLHISKLYIIIKFYQNCSRAEHINLLVFLTLKLGFSNNFPCILPAVELSFPSSRRSSHTILQGVCASNAVFVVTVTLFFPAYI